MLNFANSKYTKYYTRSKTFLVQHTISAGFFALRMRITVENYQQHFILCFDLTRTQQAAHSFLHPEINYCSVSLDLHFSNALTANLETFVWGIRSSNVFISSDRQITKNVLSFSTVWKWMKSSCRISFGTVSIWNISFLENLQLKIFHLTSQTISFWL